MKSRKYFLLLRRATAYDSKLVFLPGHINEQEKTAKGWQHWPNTYKIYPSCWSISCRVLARALSPNKNFFLQCTLTVRMCLLPQHHVDPSKTVDETLSDIVLPRLSIPIILSPNPSFTRHRTSVPIQLWVSRCDAKEPKNFIKIGTYVTPMVARRFVWKTTFLKKKGVRQDPFALIAPGKGDFMELTARPNHTTLRSSLGQQPARILSAKKREPLATLLNPVRLDTRLSSKLQSKAPTMVPGASCFGPFISMHSPFEATGGVYVCCPNGQQNEKESLLF